MKCLKEILEASILGDVETTFKNDDALINSLDCSVFKSIKVTSWKQDGPADNKGIEYGCMVNCPDLLRYLLPAWPDAEKIRLGVSLVYPLTNNEVERNKKIPSFYMYLYISIHDKNDNIISNVIDTDFKWNVFKGTKGKQLKRATELWVHNIQVPYLQELLKRIKRP